MDGWMDEGVGRRRMNRMRRRRRRRRKRRKRMKRGSRSRKEEQEKEEGKRKGQRFLGCLSEPLGVSLERILVASWDVLGISWRSWGLFGVLGASGRPLGAA
eukprot:4055962-Pyramimonas_sp.AAC.1